ncbi:adenylate/guanylate cyclase domain-containing protein [Treponema sp. R80B11-R83G3]
MPVYKKIKCVVLFLLLTAAQVFAQNSQTTDTSIASPWRRFSSSVVSIKLDKFLLYVGNQSQMAEMAENEFDMPGFEPYYGGDTPDPAGRSENYYVFKTTFSVSTDCMDRDISLYIDPTFMPCTVRVNNILIYKSGLYSDGTYSTGTALAYHIPLSKGMINYSEDDSPIENVLVIETFPQYEKNRLPEFSIAEYTFNERKVFIKNLLTSHLVLAAQVLSFLIAAYLFFLFFSRGRKDTKYLFFALMCLSFFFAYSNVGFAYSSPHDTLVQKVTRIFQMLCFPFFFSFILESVGMFGNKRKYVIAGVLAYSLSFTLLIAIQKTKQSINAMYDMMTNFNTVPILAGSILIMAFIVFFRKNIKVVPLFIIELLVAIASLRDLLILKNGIEPLFWATPYAFILLVVVTYAMLITDENFLQNAFSRYLAPEIISEIIKDPNKLNLGGEKREMTALFTDIQNFSSISEQLDPAHLVRLLNKYLTEMSNIIIEHLGTIDKYVGDAIISFFGAPLFNADHASLACRSALAIKTAEKELNKMIISEKLSPVPIFTRIGINTGEMVVGNMGAEKKMDYTIMGNAVNLASRIEGVNKQYHTGGILISEYTRAKIGDEFLLRRIDRVRVVGINTPLRLYELLPTDTDRGAVEIWEKALDLFERRDFRTAFGLFVSLFKRYPNDNVAKVYALRCKTFVKTPPPDDWDAVKNLTEK